MRKHTRKQKRLYSILTMARKIKVDDLVDFKGALSGLRQFLATESPLKTY